MAGYTDEDCEREEEEEEVLLSLLLMRRYRRLLRAANRQKWSRPLIMRREIREAYANIIRELNAEDPERFRQYLRVNREEFNEILVKVSPLIS